MSQFELEIPESLVASVIKFRQGMGIEWLHDLPGVVSSCSKQWSLTLGQPFSYPSLSFISAVTRQDGTEAVLKVGFLYDELVSEIAALRAFDGVGAVRLLEADAQSGALLIERAIPGNQLATVEDDAEAVSIAATAMRAIWRPAPQKHGYPTVEQWVRSLRKLRRKFNGSTGPLPADHVVRAEGLAGEMLASPYDKTLLHGDFQHFNLLRAEREPWLVIDPKGVVGDPAFEPGAFMGNQWEDSPEPAQLLRRRVDQFAEELGFDRKRVRGWGFVHSILSAWWRIEDEGKCSPAQIQRIEIMAEMP